MLKMKRGTFNICVRPNSIASGIDTGERKGLFNDLFGIHGNPHGYTITHLASGRICGEAHSQGDAKRKCEELSALPVDWKQNDPLHAVSEDVRTQVRQIAVLYPAKAA